MGISSNQKYLGMAQIQDGATVYFDHRSGKWNDNNTVFSVYSFSNTLHKCQAYGYGIIGGGDGSYGNGALYVRPQDLLWQTAMTDAWKDVSIAVS